MGYRYFKDLTRRKPSDKILGEKACNIAKIPKYVLGITKKGPCLNGL